MITTAFINLAYFVANLLIGIFPASNGLPQQIHTAATALGGYLGVVDVIFPVATLATVVGIVVTIELSIFGFKTFKSFLTHIPYVGGK